MVKKAGLSHKTKGDKSKRKVGYAANYMTRGQALRKLQISLVWFRRLCILKGIHPRDPSKKTMGGDKTYYYTKDIKFLMHEPILATLRQQKAHRGKVRKAKGRHDLFRLKRLIENTPQYTLHHLVKERYPSFIDALRDLDDALCMVFLFATLPSTPKTPAKMTALCKRLCTEFQAYCIRIRALRKVFVSIKGIYYQVDIFGQSIVWLTPFQFSHEMPSDVDYKVMHTFCDFYTTLVKFANFKLFQSENLKYPPKINEQLQAEDAGLSAMVVQSTEEEGAPAPSANEATPMEAEEEKSTKKAARKETAEERELRQATEARIATLDISKLEKEAAAPQDDVEEEEDDIDDFSSDGEEDDATKARRKEERELESFTSLFEGYTFFICREVPKHSLEFVIRCLGGDVAWEDGGICAEDDDRITHQIVDRPKLRNKIKSREYVQPQWVYDCLNGRLLLPVTDYAPGATLPAHLSPFEKYDDGDYIPDRQTVLERLRDGLPALPAPTEEGDAPVEEEEELSGSEADQELEEQYARELEQETEKSKPADEEDMEEAPEVPAEEETVKSRKRKRKQQEAEDEEQMSTIMMSKKHARLYSRIKHSKKRKQQGADALAAKKKKLNDARPLATK